MTPKDKKIIEDSEAKGIPIFVLTAKDRCALAAIGAYLRQCLAMGCTDEHTNGIRDRYIDFEEWKKDNKNKVKLPD